MPSLCDDDEAVLYIIAHVKICERLITSLGSLLHKSPQQTTVLATCEDIVLIIFLPVKLAIAAITLSNNQ